MIKRTKEAELIGTIRKYMTIRGTNREKVATNAAMSLRTLQNRFRNPMTFTLMEISSIFNYLKIPEEERRGFL